MIWHNIGLVLAAGAGRRFGGPKAPAIVNGQRLVDRAVAVLRDGGCRRVVVVLGAWIGPVPDADVVVNPYWEAGMSSSLRTGLTHLLNAPMNIADRASQFRRAVITLVDLPGITPEAVATLCAQPEPLLAASYGGQQGHPVLIGESHWSTLMAELSGDRGARRYLKRQAARLVPLEHLASGDDLDHPA